MKRKLIELYGLCLALVILSVFSVLIIIASCGLAIPAVTYLWMTGSVNAGAHEL